MLVQGEKETVLESCTGGTLPITATPANPTTPPRPEPLSSLKFISFPSISSVEETAESCDNILNISSSDTIPAGSTTSVTVPVVSSMIVTQVRQRTSDSNSETLLSRFHFHFGRSILKVHLIFICKRQHHLK